MDVIPWNADAVLLVTPIEGEPVPYANTLQEAVEAWSALPVSQQATATISIEQEVAIEGARAASTFVGGSIGDLVNQLPQ